MAALDRLGAADVRRLQLRAEAGGGIGVLVAPAAERPGGQIGAAAAVRLLVASIPEAPPERIEAGWAAREAERFSVRVMRCRGGLPAGCGAIVEVDRATLLVRAAPLVPE